MTPTHAAAVERARVELADIRAHRHDRAAARVRTAVELGANAETAERQRRAVAATVPDKDGSAYDHQEAQHGLDHEPGTRPHACPLCAEDTGDPFGMFIARTIGETVAALAALLPVECPATPCSYYAHDAADLAEHTESNHPEDEADAGGIHGRCDTCGAPCDAAGCTRDRGHTVALDVDDPRP